MKCLALRTEDRYQRACEISHALADLKSKDKKTAEMDDIRERIRARERSTQELCWNCRRQLPFRAATCPHCGESAS
jgi:hypothetical protein